MSMQSPAHPDPERLAALAGNDREALADRALTEHVAECQACGTQVRDLTALRAALAELPDLAPSRPLRLLPPVPEPAPSGGWRIAVRRAFAPVAVAGMVLLLVGSVGATGALGPADVDVLFDRLRIAAPAAYENLDGQPDQLPTDAGGPAAPDELASSPDASGRFGVVAQSDEPYVSDTTGGSAVPRATDATSEAAAEADESTGYPLTVIESRGPWIAAALAGLGLLALALVLRRVTVPADRGLGSR